MNIGAAARQSGLPAKTIRYYEETGLLRRAARARNGYRHYADADVHKLRFIRHARELGFTIEECRSLLSLYENRRRRAADVKKLVKRHIAGIDAKVDELARMRAALAHLVAACAGDHRPECPILDGLAGD
jgi:Cu(I)-responsive transcriptional regulator